MFDQVPNRRITARRQSFKDALIAVISLMVGVGEVLRKGRVDWEMLGWAVVFILSAHSYWKGRHADPWNPPDVDAKERYYGALERRDP